MTDTEALKPLVVAELTPGVDLNTDEDLLNYARNTGATSPSSGWYT